MTHGQRRRPAGGGAKLAGLLLRRVLPASHVSDVIGDLEERCGRRRANRRGLAARAWYWRQVLQFLVGVAVAPRLGAVSSLPDRRRNLMRDLLHDLRHAARGLVRQPGFTIVAAVTLALGLGANTAIFSVIDALMLRPLDYPEADRLVRLYHYDARSPGDDNVVTGMDYLDYREGVSAFAELAASYTYNDTGFDLEPRGGGPARRVRSLSVSSNYFDAFGVPPLIGRGFHVEEESGEARVAVVSERLWRDVMAADEAALGAGLLLSGDSWQVIGVMPSSFKDPVVGDVDVWVPETLTPGGYNNRDNYYLTVVGRLADDATLPAAQEELDALAAQLAETYPDTNEHKRSRIRPLHRDLVGTAAPTLWTLMGASVFVLLIACANVANLQIARGTARRKELAVRSALGSGRGRLVRQLLAEGLLLSLIGGGLGLALAGWTTGSLLRLAPERLTRINVVAFEGRVFGFAVLAMLLTTCLFGVAPAFRAVGGGLETALREGGRGDTSGAAQSRLRAVLVVAEVALALALLVGAGLLIRSSALLRSQDLGITDDPVLTFELRLPAARYPDVEERVAFYDELRARIAALPGVAASGAVQWLPAAGHFNIWGYFIADPEAEQGYVGSNANIRVVSGEYFEAAGVTLVAGRLFDGAEAFGGESVTVVNQRLVRESFPDSDPLGRTIRVAGRDHTIVGVVSDVSTDPRNEPYRTVHFPHAQWADRNWALFQMVRSARPVDGLMASIRAQVAEIDPALVAFNARSLSAAIGRGEAQTRFAMLLLGVFASVAAALAGIGIYGVLAFSVGQRRREIGIRMALGARAGQVQSDVVRRGLGLVAAGCLGGFAIAAVAARLLAALLYGIGPADPLVLSVVALLVGMVAMVASWVPARRASRVPPVQALRA